MKEWTVEEIKSLIAKNDTVLCKAMIQLYNQQTAVEQLCQQTKAHNSVGFNCIDSKFLTSCSEFYLKSGFLTSRQVKAVRKTIMKYSKQLTWLANEHEKNKETVRACNVSLNAS